MSATITSKIDEAIKVVQKFIMEHREGIQAPLSLTMLVRVQGELEKMRTHLSPIEYVPTYSRFVMDWPDHKGLVKQLLNVAYEYNRIKN